MSGRPIARAYVLTLLALTAVSPRSAAAQRPLKIYISVDMEGITGVVSSEWNAVSARYASPSARPVSPERSGSNSRFGFWRAVKFRPHRAKTMGRVQQHAHTSPKKRQHRAIAPGDAGFVLAHLALTRLT